MRRLLVLLTTVSAVVAGVALASPSGAEDTAAPLPVTYNFLAGAAQQGLAPSPDAPGTNDWSCTPSKAHPRPVVLVHGTSGARDTNWPTYGPLLSNHGYCVFALTYGGAGPDARIAGLGRIQDSAVQLRAFVTRVRRATGARKVDLVGHSQGTLMPNYYLRFLGGAPYVRRYVSIAPLWHGTRTATPFDELAKVFAIPDGSAPACAACPQMASGSAFMAKMRRGGVVVDGVDYTNIVTRYDQLVTPYTSGIQRGMRNIVVQDVCARDLSEHFEIVSSPVVARIVLNRLDPAHREPVPCTPVLPYVGPVA
jgi:triacylglycerol lipase